MNPYKILNLPNNCKLPEAKKQFRKLSLEMHPDKGGDETKYAQILEAYKLIMGGYKVETPIYKPKPKPNDKTTFVDVFITLEEGMNGCSRNINLKDGIMHVNIPVGMLPMQSCIYEGCGEKNEDGIRGNLSITIKFIMPEGFTFEKYLTETVLVYSVKLKNIPKTISITLCGKTKKIKMPSKIYDGMFLKVKDFGYCNNGKKNPLFVRICI